MHDAQARKLAPDSRLALAILLWIPISGVRAQPTLEVRDSVVFEESSDNYLVYPGSVVPDGTGGFLVTDYRQPRVFHYSAEGVLIRGYGERGQGPGEWEEAQIALPHGSGHVLVLSWKPFAVQRFDRQSGRFVERFPLRGYVESAAVEEDRDELWLSGPHYTPRSAVRRLQLGDEEAEPVVDLPGAYTEGSPVGGMFNSVPFTRWADTLLVAFMPLRDVILAGDDGRELDRFVVPAVHRRQAPADPAAAIEESLEGGDYFGTFSLFSLTRGVHRRPDGSFLLVHGDFTGDDPPLRTETLWVSVVHQDRSSACPDARLSPESHPVIGFEGDALLVLEQVLRGGDAATVLRRIAVGTDGCDWIPLTR